MNGLKWKWTCEIRLNLPDMRQTTSRGKLTSAVIEVEATACNETRQHFVDWVHRDMRISNCCCWWNDSSDSVYIMQDTEPDKSHGKRKLGKGEQNLATKGLLQKTCSAASQYKWLRLKTLWLKLNSFMFCLSLTCHQGCDMLDEVVRAEVCVCARVYTT